MRHNLPSATARRSRCLSATMLTSLLNSLSRILLICLILLGPSSLSSSIPLSLSTLSPSLTVTSESQCEAVEVPKCSRSSPMTSLPNAYGHYTQPQAVQELNKALGNFVRESEILVTFFCTLYLPPCHRRSVDVGSEGRAEPIPLPCRSMCEKAFSDSDLSEAGSSPVRCQTLPTENCYDFDGPTKARLVKKSLQATATTPHEESVLSFAPLEAELGDDSVYEVEVVSLSTSRIPARRYDIVDLGDPELYHGWADVQGSGAANDYCRVIGKEKRRFISCNLAGSKGQGHQYVSKLGFDPGHKNTWFMRDMDGDGRDDYCRCVGPKNNQSEMKCMKGGDKGFYGSTLQGGSQYTFTLPVSNGCHNKRLNSMFGD